MSSFNSGQSARLAVVGFMTCTAAIAGSVIFPAAAFAAEDPIGLGTAKSYSVLGGQTVTNTGSTTLGADLGVSPGTALPVFESGMVSGATHADDAHAAQAQLDLTTAFDDASSRATTELVAGDLVGRTLPAGVYTASGPLALSGELVLDGQGDPTSVFVFKVAETLITASSSTVTLTNGAQACNVFWQVGSSATLGTDTSFKGTIMALTSISVTTGARVEGRALARNGAVTLDSNVFTVPGCDMTPVVVPPVVTPDVPPVVADAPPVVTPPTAVVAPQVTKRVAAPELADTGLGQQSTIVLGLSGLLLVLGTALIAVSRRGTRTRPDRS